MLLAEATNTPVWWLVRATAALTCVTGALAAAAIRALRQLQELRRDRHVQVLSEFNRRWDEPHLWEACRRQFEIPADDLARLVGRWFEARDPTARDVPVLLRVPNFFEDLSIIVEVGDLEVKYVALGIGSLALGAWAYWEPAIKRMRRVAPTSYTQFEKLIASLDETRLE